MIDITETQSRAEVQLTARFTGGPEMKASFTSWTYDPNFLRVTYRYLPESAAWDVIAVDLYGARILKPGPNGEQRLGKDQGHATWFLMSEVPAWVMQLAREMAPVGEVTFA